ncbi:MAG TPA: hypothetical protein VKI40_11310 [Terriglobales bacterium]|nr:hypothetical protein [Terriglobales bacterium]
MPIANVQLVKSRLKYGPRMSRQMRVEFLSVQTGAAPRTLSPATLAKIRLEIQRLGQSTNPRVRQFVAAMRTRYPEVAA